MSIIDNVKEILSIVQKLDDIELYRKIVELEGEIIELTREKREVEEKLAQIQRSQEIIEKLKFDSPFYTTDEGPELYCARCVEADRRAIHLVNTGDHKLRRRIWECPHCKTRYVDTRPGRSA